MKKYLTILFICALSLFSFNAFAFTTPAAPTHGYIVDQAGELSAEQISQLNTKIDKIKQVTKNEFGILIVQSVDDSDIDDIAYKTFNSWGVGQKGLDNGVLIVIAVKKHKDRIETGRGVGAEVTDLQANDILKKNLSPHLKAGDFAGGLNETLDALAGLMESRAKPAATPVSSSGGCDVSIGGIGGYLAAAFGILIAFFFMIRYKARTADKKSKKEELKAKRIANEEEAKRNIDVIKCRDLEQREAEIIRNTRHVVIERPSSPIHLPPRKTVPPVKVIPEVKPVPDNLRRIHEREEENYRLARQREQEARDRTDRRRQEEADAAISIASLTAVSFLDDNDNSNNSSSGFDIGGFDSGSSCGGGSDDSW